MSDQKKRSEKIEDQSNTSPEEKTTSKGQRGNGDNKEKETIESKIIAHEKDSSLKKVNYPKVTKGFSQSKISKGPLLEYRIKRLLFFMGYFSKIGVELKTSQDDEAVIITDLDVYGFNFNKDFSNRTLWVDCKSGNARTHERIAWIKGIMSTVKIDDALFVKSGIRTEIKQYASKYSIRVLDLNILEKLESEYDIDKTLWEGSFDAKSQFNQIDFLKKFSIPTNLLYKKIAKFISVDYWILDDYSRVKKIITALRELSPILDSPLNDKQSKAMKWAVYELVSLFSMSVLNICRELNYYSDHEKRKIITDALSAGDVSNKKRKEIFDAAFRIAYGVVQNQIPEFKPPNNIPPVNLSPPNYTEAFCGLIDRVTKSPLNYYDVARFLDFSLMEYDFKDKDINEKRLMEIFKNYVDVSIGAKTILHYILQVTNIPKSYFSLID